MDCRVNINTTIPTGVFTIKWLDPHNEERTAHS
jgi:hypothetical protein